jgi:hypothetical protein
MANVPEIIAAAPVERDAPEIAIGRVNRLASLLFVGVVVLLLVVPLAQTLFPVLGTIVPAVDEHRQPSPFPAPSLLLKATGDFASGLNAWFDDRVGFRDLFIRAKNQIDYSLFSTSAKVYVGKDSWLFRRGDLDPLARVDTAGMAAVEGRFVKLAKMLEDKGLRLIVIGYPDKSRIYPEMASPQMRLARPGGNYDKLREFLAGQSTLTFIDADAILKREKLRTNERIYFKTDLHATESGQIPVVKEIIAQIARAEGRSEIQWNENFTVVRGIWGPGGEGRFLAPLLPITETDVPYFTDRYTVGGEDADGTWNIPDPRVLQGIDDGVGRAFDFEFRSRPELCPQRLPGMVLFGNSFSDSYWTMGLQRYFCFIRRARDPMSRFKLFYDTIPEGAKYFIFEYYSLWLPADSPPIAEIEH